MRMIRLLGLVLIGGIGACLAACGEAGAGPAAEVRPVGTERESRSVGKESETMIQSADRSASGDANAEERLEHAMFGAGCFWGVELYFSKLDGVVETEVGYSGGDVKNPSYKQVCSGDTGHAEVVRVKFDPEVISYEELLDHFWKVHDPTQVNRQGPDFGSQYRTAIFYYNEDQRKAAEAAKERLEKSGKHDRPIATEITEAGEFWRAEEYHQDYLRKRGIESCRIPG